MKFILASQSPQRRRLLKKLKIPFIVHPSYVREPDAGRINHAKAVKLVKDLAVLKARFVAKKFKKENCWVLGADTLVVCDKKILGKPKNEKDAQRILSTLSGRWQKVVTGVCLIKNPEGKTKISFDSTSLRFKKLDEKTILKLAKKNHDKSGAYAIQKMNDKFIRDFRGDLDNVIGLPVHLVKKMVRSMGAK